MFVNEFESSNAYRLQQIISTLKNVHGVDLDLNSQQEDQVRALGESCEIIKNSIVKESAFNTWMQNPEYTKQMLILEAVRIYLAEIAPKRMNKKRKIKESSLGDVVDATELGRAMMDYAQHKEHGGDEKELRILNAISQVGDKLTQLGTPFGPKTLTDMDKKVIQFAKQRMAQHSMAENTIQPNKPNSPQNAATNKAAPGMVNLQKGNDKKTVPAAQVANLQKQGYGIVGDDQVQETDDELEALMKKYGVSESRKDSKKVMMDKKTKGKKINEAAHMESHDDYQASMARSELYRNTKYAMDLMKMIGPNDDIKPWIAANLTKAAASLDKIYHYMDYYTTFEPDESSAAQTPVDEDAELSVTSGSVARQNLLMIMEYSTKLFRMIQPGDKLEGWVAMKLTNASESISSSKHYMDYAQFEKHIGHEMSDIVDEPVDLPVPVEENKGKKKKKAVKEGRMVTIGNILMSSMLKEDQDLAQAETLLAAKSMSDDLQAMAEKLAKMSVENLMPLVDTMKEQFGQDIANGFNTTMKAALEAVLNSATEAKETTDNAILSMQSGQVPGVGATDIEAVPTMEPPAPEGNDEVGDDFAGTPAASGPEDEPLGRAKKPEADAEAPAELEESKKLSAKQEKFFGKKDKSTDKKGKTADKNSKPDFLDVDKDGDKKEPMKKAAKDKKKVNETYKSVNFGVNLGGLNTFDPKLGALAKNIETAIEAEVNLDKNEKAALANILSHLAAYSDDASNWDDAEERMDNAINAVQHALDPRKPEAKKIINSLKKLAHGIAFKHEGGMSERMMEAKKAKPDFLDVDKDGDKKEPMKKAAKDKAKGKDKVEESAPPGKKAEDFIKKNKAEFKERYGDRWEEVLYATAWKKFGDKKESVINAAKMLESAKASKAKLEKMFEAHKRNYKRMVIEGKAVDLLNTGYGLEGETLLDQISDVDGMITKLKEMLKTELRSGMDQIKSRHAAIQTAEILEARKNQAPYGVIWIEGNQKKNKFFESEDLRAYWMDLNEDILGNHKVVNPEDFNKRINELNSRKG